MHNKGFSTSVMNFCMFQLERQGQEKICMFSEDFLCHSLLLFFFHIRDGKIISSFVNFMIENIFFFLNNAIRSISRVNFRARILLSSEGGVYLAFVKGFCNNRRIY